MYKHVHVYTLLVIYVDSDKALWFNMVKNVSAVF